MPDRPAIHVHLLPSLIPPGALRGGVAVVVDVLRATTAMVHALAAGCEAIIPCAEIEEARAVAASLAPGTAILGGERGGLPIEGFDLGNSPGDYTPEVCRGKTLVMTTTNGTRAILACREAERVLIGSFVNSISTARALKGDPRPKHIVCAGTEGHISLEDATLAGALCFDLGASHDLGSDDSAHLVERYWVDVEYRCFEKQETTLADYLARGRGGQNVIRIGLEGDIADAAEVDQVRLVAEVQRNPLRIVGLSFQEISDPRLLRIRDS
jgi:2-phosphosulfolactate phosphatase